MTGDVSATRLAEVTHLSYRRLDYYTRRGFVTPRNPDPGSGGRRAFAFAEAVKVAVIAELVAAGVQVTTAAAIANGAAPARIEIDISSVEDRLREALSK